MRIQLFIVALFSVVSFLDVRAQDADADPGPGSVTVFSETGDKFKLYLNGQLHNAVASERVVVPSVTEVPVSFRIVFDGAIPEITKRGIRQGTNCTYVIVKNKKGERSLKVGGCTNEPASTATSDNSNSDDTQAVAASPAPVSTPDQLSATYSNGVITINDGRTLTVKKVKANGMTYPRVMMTALTGAKVSIKYDSNDETFSAETPFQYEVKDFSNNNAYFTLTVDEGGPAKTWKIKLQNANGYDLKIE